MSALISTGWRSRLQPTSVAGQIALLVVTAIIATHVVAGVALFVMREPWKAEGRPGVAANRVAVIARILDAADPAERGAILANAARGVPSLRLAEWDGTEALRNEDLAEHPIVERLREAFGNELTIADLGSKAASEDVTPLLRIGLLTPSGARFRATLPDEPLGPPRRGPIVLTLLFLATSLLLLSVWATRALTAPLAQLADAAEAFGTRAEPPPLPRRGPAEVLALAAALDRMRERVNRLIDDRTQMLAAISHDLRTPITRLRLRSEFIEEEQVKERMLRDLDQMNALVDAALNFARGESASEKSRHKPLIDLASLVQTVCDGFDDVGADVRMGQVRHVLVRADPDDLQRAITNLVDNAVKYAGAARLSMLQSAHRIVIEVADDGPGIPEADQDSMLQPFVRGDRARNLNDTSGFGLGLSIVLAIVEAHEGRLILENGEGGGLSARIDLPLATAEMAFRPASTPRLAAE